MLRITNYFRKIVKTEENNLIYTATKKKTEKNLGGGDYKVL